eukprot:TRINITY_DN2608_c0_g2_i2.p1 TRINITY_DN2608_c0_g2~~TRINITY_DN2608_c0_g2_i2.p1  ORF type:complete len:885 (+),score=218.24 TRINITY_DN2608_c0_g2_i2:81-2657(+)
MAAVEASAASRTDSWSGSLQPRAPPPTPAPAAPSTPPKKALRQVRMAPAVAEVRAEPSADPPAPLHIDLPPQGRGEGGRSPGDSAETAPMGTGGETAPMGTAGETSKTERAAWPASGLTVDDETSQRRPSDAVDVAGDFLRRLNAKRRCGVEIEDTQRDAEIRCYALGVAVFNFLGLFLNCLNYGLIPPPFLEDRDAGCAGCPNDLDLPGVSDAETAWYVALQALVSVLTFASLVMIVVYHRRLFRAACDQARQLEANPPQLLANGGVKRWVLPLLCELAVVAPHPVVFYARRRGFVYITCWMFLRLYALPRWAGLSSVLYRNRFEVFAQDHLRNKYASIHVSWSGIVRTLFIRYPTTFCFGFTGVCLFSCAVCVFYAERNEAGGPDAPQYTNLADSMWFMFITYTTIGYGDMYPGSNLGKIVTCVAGVLGVVVANLMAGLLANRLEATPAEQEMLTWLDKQHRIEDYQTASRELVASYWRDKMRARKTHPSELLLGGRAWNPCRNLPPPAAGEEQQPPPVCGGWVRHDRVIAPADVKRGKKVEVPKGTQGVVQGAVHGMLLVNWEGGIGTVEIKPGEDIPSVGDDCRPALFISECTRQKVKKAREAREAVAEVSGASNFDAEEETRNMQAAIQAFGKHFDNLVAHNKSALHRSQEILLESNLHRGLVSYETSVRHIAEREFYHRNTVVAQEELQRMLFGDSMRDHAAALEEQWLMEAQVNYIVAVLRDKVDVPFTSLATDLGAIRQKLEPFTPPPPPPPPPASDLPGYLRPTRSISAKAANAQDFSGSTGPGGKRPGSPVQRVASVTGSPTGSPMGRGGAAGSGRRRSQSPLSGSRSGSDFRIGSAGSSPRSQPPAE